MRVAIQKIIFDICQLLPLPLQSEYKRNTKIVIHPQFKRGPQGQLLETKGEYNANTGKITCII